MRPSAPRSIDSQACGQAQALEALGRQPCAKEGAARAGPVAGAFVARTDQGAHQEVTWWTVTVRGVQL